MEKLIYTVVDGNNKSQKRKRVVNFYNRYFPEKSNPKAVANSSALFIAEKNERIIGCCRLLTDYSRNGILFDLTIRKIERRKGVGKELIKMALDYCREKSIKKVYLMTDPRHNWLTRFYQKQGFKIIEDQTLMKIEN